MSLLKSQTKEAKVLADKCPDNVDNVISKVDSISTTKIEYSENYTKKNIVQENHQFSTITIRMLNFCREFAIFCLVIMTYAAFSKEQPKISKSPAAYRFFPENSLVTDWYRGQISKAIEHARSSDIAFVMFYAPWDADSQKGRKEFEKAAEYMQNRVNFVAVNCWQPLGECRTQYNKVYKWPVLIAYLPHGRGVQYNGLLSAPHLIQFLKKVCNPIKHLGNEGIRDFQDAYVKAELNVSPGSVDYAVFYTAALRYLEKDPQYRITFYITPLNLTTPALSLYMWNETLMFPNHEVLWTSDNILQWIFKSTHQITSWVLPSGSKSVAFFNAIQNGPALILFTPKNALLTNIDYYNMLQEIAQEYYSCEENIVTKMLASHLKLRRTTNFLIHKQLKLACHITSKIINPKIVSRMKPAWANVTTCSQKEKSKNCDLLADKSLKHNCVYIKNNCIEMFPIGVNEPLCKNTIDTSVELLKTSVLSGIGDYRSAENLKRVFQSDRCKEFLEAEKNYPAIFAKAGTSQKNITIMGLSCRTNKSLTLFAMDSLLYSNFAQRLGIDLNNQLDNSAVVILNDKMESHYILQEPITSETIKEFISNFSKNRLNRSYSSIATLAPQPQVLLKTKSQMFVRELDSSTFLPTVLQDHKLVIVLYYSKQCSFCNGISYTFLTVARKLSLMKNIIFARIDGDVNILPWEYTMETYPTILFFPSKRKSESRIFPSGIPINVPNLIGFLLVNFEPNLKLQALWSICLQTKLATEQSSCYSTLLRETLNLIYSTLKEWRKSQKRQILLHRLKSLRQLHLLFAHAPHKRNAVLNFFQTLDFNARHIESNANPLKSNSPRSEL